MIKFAIFWETLFCSVAVFWLLPMSVRYGFLGLVSVALVYVFDPKSAALLASLTVGVYWFAPHFTGGGRRARPLTGGIVLVLCITLFYFKYLPQLLSGLGQNSGPSVVLPLGLSYYIFKLIHYVIEVGRENIKNRSFQSFLCYMFLFPVFSAGPVERYEHLLSHQEKTWRYTLAVDGVTRIIHGLIKQFFIVQSFLPFANQSFSLPKDVTMVPHCTTLQTWAFLTSTYLGYYMSFSAYSDIAIGASRLFGFHIIENFNFPIAARNIREFWRRWHISLGSWCQNYLYIPVLAHTRKPTLALYTSFIFFGLWHSGTVSRVVWGVVHASGVLVFVQLTRILRKSKASRPPPRWSIRVICAILGIAVTQLFVIASTAFLLDESNAGLRLALRVLAKLFAIQG